MYNVSPHGNSDTQGGSCVEMGRDLPIVGSDSVATDISDGISSPLDRSPQDFNFDAIAALEVCKDNFLQEYATRCGYRLTEDFLFGMAKLKIRFVDGIDSVLVELFGDFSSSLKGSENDNKNMLCSMNKVGSPFYKFIYNLRYKCINNLQRSIIPIAIKNIFCSKIIDGYSNREMTYPEMEQMFLYFVTTLEKIIMVKVMKCLYNFYSKNKDITSFPDVGHIDEFICTYRFYGSANTDTACPAAFTRRFEEYISFMAIAKIDKMMSSFVDSCNDVLKEVVCYKCAYVYGYSSDVHGDLRKLYGDFHGKFDILIRKEFSKKILEAGIKDKINDFLSNLVIWGKGKVTESNKLLILNRIIKYMRNLLLDKSTNDALNIISNFNKSKFLPVKRLSESWKRKWGLNVHPGDIYKISSIRRKFIAKSRGDVMNKFGTMLREKHAFSDGTVISIGSWRKVSKNIFPVAQEIVRNLVDEEREELSNFLFDIRILDDNSIFDWSSYSIRNATREERDKILKISSDFIYSSNRDSFRLVWMDLIKNKKDNILKNSDVGGSLIPNRSVRSESQVLTSVSVDLLSKRDEVINTWGLNLHPDDNSVIFFIIRKFSNEIRNHLTELFSSMLRRKVELPNGIMMCNSSWPLISGVLSEVAKKSVNSITKEQHVELHGALSKSRIVVANENGSFCIIRSITDDEKKDLMVRANKFIDKRLKSSIRLAWLRVVSKSSTEIGYGYKDRSKVFPGSGKEGSWGVKLRYSDNLAILRVRRKFSSKIKDVVYRKFSTLLENKHEFGDGTFIGAFAWIRVSEKLIPIAKEEIGPILEDQRKELEEVISRSLVVDSVYREPTDEEKGVILKNIMNLSRHALKVSFKRVWDKIIVSLGGDSISEVGCVLDVPSPSVDVVEACYIDRNRDNSMKVKLCYEYDYAIINVKRKFSFKVSDAIRNKYTEMLGKNHRFDDDTVIGVYSWGSLSEKILPVITEEINPIIEEEYREISDILSKSRVDVSSSVVSSVARTTREVTNEERMAIIESIMKSVRKQTMRKFRSIWSMIIKSPLVSFVDLKEEYKSGLDNVRLEFIGNLGSILNGVVGSSDSLSSDVSDIVEMGHNLFNEGGFFNRVESLLSDAKAVDVCGKDRLITDEEKKYVLKVFMDTVSSDRDCLVKRRVSKLNKFHFSQCQ